MNLCSDDHDEVCYEGRACPCCNIKEYADRRIAKLESELESAEVQINDLNKQIEDSKPE